MTSRTQIIRRLAPGLVSGVVCGRSIAGDCYSGLLDHQHLRGFKRYRAVQHPARNRECQAGSQLHWVATFELDTQAPVDDVEELVLVLVLMPVVLAAREHAQAEQDTANFDQGLVVPGVVRPLDRLGNVDELKRTEQRLIVDLVVSWLRWLRYIPTLLALVCMTSTRIDWVAGHCQLLQSISAEFKDTQPFRGLTIGTGIHLEAKTVALLLTLRDGGARVVSTGNLNTTQPEAVDALKAQGVAVIGGPTRNRTEHDSYLDGVIAARPDLILDNGGDLFAKYLDGPYEGLRGGTEETTSGRMRLEPLRARLRLPILVINDSPIKQFAENEHAVGQSTLESYLRLTNRVTNGENVTVFGYGACGRGVAANFRGACARVTVAEVNPVTRLQAHLDGFSTPPRAEAIASADLIITVTGARDVITPADLPLLRDGVILANAGHFPWEIDVDGLLSAPDVAGTREYTDDLMTLELKDGRRIHVISRGHMFNLAGPRPLGNSIESMDLGFALQARCLEAVATGAVDASSCVVPVPASIDAAVASSYLDRKYTARSRG